LVRHDGFSSARAYGDDLATNEVILNLCTGINRRLEIKPQKLFINCSEELLKAEGFLPLPPANVVIELPAATRFDGILINRIKEWRARGFRFSLDDFDFSKLHLELVEYFDYLKVDALDRSLSRHYEKIAALSPRTVIAKRIETEKLYNALKTAGFNLFQGYFLAKPKEIQGHAVRGKINNTVATFDAVTLHEIEIESMVEFVNRDPSLAVQLLKIVNSPACELVRPISSIKEAIVFLGLIQVRKWIIMMSLLNDSAASVGAMNIVLTRAKACENYAAGTLSIRSDQAFLIGLLSGANLLFDIDTNLFLDALPLHQETVRAITGHDGILGQVLNEIKTIEYQILQQDSRAFELDEELVAAYQDAYQWAEQILATAKAA
jgi:EAL and modified HD-GYP domain-containing signal transduction protein